MTAEGDDADIHEKYGDVFTGVGKLMDFQLKLSMKDNVTPVAQAARRLQFGLSAKIDEKLDKLLAKDIIEEVSRSPTEWAWCPAVGCGPEGRRRNSDLHTHSPGKFSNREGGAPHP